MQNIIDIKNHVKSIKDTAQITKAMEFISVSRMRKANDKFQKNSRYFLRVRQILNDILNHKGDIQHSYLQHRATQRTAFVIIAGDNGLAGDYNRRVLDFAMKQMKEVSDEKSIFIIGQMANEYFRREGIIPDVEFLYYGQDPTLEDARRITGDLVNLYDENMIDEVRIIYTAESHKQNEAHMLRLLPLLKEDFIDEDGVNKNKSDFEFDPSAEEVFDILAPQYVVGLTYSCLIQAVRCEHSERMVTMHNATNNAQQMTESLELEYHRARQAQITTELTEISSFKTNL
ncbi:MAG: ATP synthase F1 subunit gamma [Christensenellaceae bacterium]|jgi:F-type H+-transporting ATPase subunit gamma|nr:ATP synthase F1 subunit gamma [Christensenellaceae bacterium]